MFALMFYTIIALLIIAVGYRMVVLWRIKNPSETNRRSAGEFVDYLNETIALLILSIGLLACPFVFTILKFISDHYESVVSIVEQHQQHLSILSLILIPTLAMVTGFLIRYANKLAKST